MRRDWQVRNRPRNCLTLVLGAMLITPAGDVSAQPPRETSGRSDKSGYHLFDPTPRALMREMSTDRPDTTESPRTVDAGHFQLEMSFVDFTREDEDGVR